MNDGISCKMPDDQRERMSAFKSSNEDGEKKTRVFAALEDGIEDE